MPLFPELQAHVVQLLAEAPLIPPARQQLLQQLAAYLRQQTAREAPLALHFICTHNSRRSQIAQVWAATAAAYFAIPNLTTYSGGTEATAFNPRAVAALERVGFRITHPGGDNPHYQVQAGSDLPPLVCFSKTIGDGRNPQTGFAAIMTCAEADESCPLVPGAAWRLALTYEDPKVADDTPAEADRYDERVAQIGRELLYAFHLVIHHHPDHVNDHE
ncbi:MAG: protein-tyrosine-phosphatase [Bacteroidetes bacterium]|nr:MAG: protein-tyrosine-phosphatase [Bacteroidota bacterium]